MPLKYFIILIIFSLTACRTENQENKEIVAPKVATEEAFDKNKWQLKEGKDYPYRAQMLNDVLYNDTIRTLNKNAIIALLGEPDYYRDDTTFLYYRISENRLFTWSLTTKTMVVKLAEAGGIDWIKLHE
jgi:hypothetical protein